MTGTPEEVQRIETELVRRVTEAGPGKGLLGAQLGVVIRTLLPDFQPQAFGARTLRDFIERHIPSLRIIGFSGPDPMYGLRTTTSVPSAWAPSSAQTPTGGYDLWRVWASPAAPLALAVRRETGETRSILKDESPSEAEVKIQPAAFELHRSIAGEFLKTHESMPGAVLAQLRHTLDEAKGPWWRRWAEILGDFPEINHAWFDYRRRGLESALQAALRNVGLDLMQVDRACREITTRPQPTIRRQTLGSPGGPVVLPTSQSTELRGLVQSVVARMGDNELRALSLPVGLVLDVLARGSVKG